VTKTQLERVSTHVLGHALTNTAFRKKMESTMRRKGGDHEAMARTINAAIKPEIALKGSDIPALRKHLMVKLKRAQLTAPRLRVASLASGSCGMSR